jgi:cytidine deaminase
MATLDQLLWLPNKKTLQQEKAWLKSQLKAIGKVKIKELVKAAVAVRQRAYPPYSHYYVGAAILAKSGKIYASCNAETASLTETEHAERSAIVKAISEGEIQKSDPLFIKAVAVSHQKDSGPCGGCRQSITQHCRNALIIDATPKGKIQAITSLRTLLPYSFSPHSEKTDIST